jgi:hypothetical protein
MRKLVFLLPLLLTLTACATDITDFFMVSAVGLDDYGDGVTLTLSSDEHVISQSARSFEEAFAELQEKSDKHLFLGQVHYVLLGGEANLDFIMSRPRVHKGALVFCAENAEKVFLENQKLTGRLKLLSIDRHVTIIEFYNGVEAPEVPS